MKIKSLILAFPVLCLACSSPSSTSDPAYQADASPNYAKRVAGVNALSTDANYDEPCNLLGEEYIRTTFNLDEKAKLEEVHEHDGCEFEWAGSKVLVSFGGRRPYSSIYLAEATFDKMFQGKSAASAMKPAEVVNDSTTSGPETEGTNAETSAKETVSEEATHNTNDNHPQHEGVTAATPHLTKPAVSTGSFEAVANVGDKAVWNASTGAMHVLYNNHIINVTVETKGNAEQRKEQAKSLAEVLIDKIAENEYVKRL